ncbi:intermembrane lipid transfer protein VPS13B [Erinaceus europaeus]|uniref:Intermembrane lipid transfer protein VPS13B n=1 Tax=Erinaceus europaeus TaxID=9365 RepID=A0ABM3XSF5_ERIEU|nr:intermembrane lipid transfer protein VPS13B [Erinaceus europaeus]
MLESYVTPILMSYVNRYIKNLKPSDLQLSIWGGDVVLSKLELKLEVLEQELKLPFTFLSGHIHELRIHVPWTKLGSEPVVITINTMECILKLKDGIQDDHDSCGSNSTNHSTTENTKLSAKPRRIQQAAPTDPDLPPGYVQSLIRRVVNNVNIVINNLILKYVEDDIVLSVNITSAECYTVGELWDRAFMDISATDLVLRKVINFSDCTVCLDKRNASGKIEFYQDPLLYKCSFRTRLHFTYDNLNSKMPSVIKIHTLVESLKLSITDQQLPMFIRIMQLGIALYYGEIGSFKDGEMEDPTCHDKDMLGNIAGTEDEARIDVQYPAQYKSQELYSQQEDEQPQGWVSWAWSFVPAIVSYDDGEDDYLGNDPTATTHQQKAQTLKDPVISVGFYCTKATVTFKLTEMQTESSYYSPQKVKSKEILCWEQEGTTVEALMMGEPFFDCQIGFVGCRALCLKGIMGVKDFEENMNRSETEACFFICGENLSMKGLTYLTNSLFDYRSPENNGTRAEFILDATHHKEVYTELAGMQRFGAFYMDYLYTMENTSGKGSPNQQDFSPGKTDDLGIVEEKSTKNLVIGPLDFHLDSSAVHRIMKMIVCALEHEYEPYTSLKPDIKNETETVLNYDEVASLEEYIPTRQTSITLLKCTCTILMAEFNLLDHLLPVIMGEKNSSNFTNTTSFQSLRPLPSIQIVVDKINLEHSVPMYAEHLVHVVSNLTQPSDNLLHYCYAHCYLKIFGFQAGLTALDCRGSYCLPVPIIPSFSTALYVKLLKLPTFWTNRSQIPITEGIFELPNLTLQGTRAQTLLLQAIYQSWSHIGNVSSLAINEALMNEVFQTRGVKSKNPLPTLEGSIQNVELKYCCTSLVKCASGTMGSIKICAKAPGDSGKDKLIPLLQGPSDTKDLHSSKWLNESRKPESLLAPDLIAFTVQVPQHMDYCHNSGAVLLCSVQGLAVNIDPVLYNWLLYQPQKRTSRHMQQQPVVTVPLVIPTSRRKEDEISVGSAPLAKQQSCQASEYASSPIKTKTITESRPLSVPVKTMLKMSEGCKSPEERMKEFIGTVWNAVKCLTLQLEVQSCCVFIPNDNLPSPSTIVSGDIPGTVRSWYHGQTSMPGTLVFCFPQIKIISAGHKCMEPLQEIPFVIPRPILEEGDAFPWTINLHHFSVYTLFGKQVTLCLVEPMGCTSTLAVTSQKLLSTGPDTRHSFVVCLHVDLESLEIKCSNSQVQLLYELTDIMNKVWNKFQKRSNLSCSAYPETLAGPVPSSPVRSSVGTAPPDTSTCSPSADVGTTTEGDSLQAGDESPFSDSVTLEQTTSNIGGSSGRVSLWMQWVLPKITIKLFAPDPENIGTELCMVSELEDLSASIDVQDVYTKVKCKIESFNIDHYRSRQGEGWQSGHFEGIFLQCKEKPVTTAKLLEGSHQQHGFLSLTYTKAVTKNVRHKLTSRNERRSFHKLSEGLMDASPHFLHEILLSAQAFDIVLCFPLLNAITSIFQAKLPKTQKEKRKSPGQPMRTHTLTSRNLPLIYINTSVIRIFVPKTEEMQSNVEVTQAAKEDTMVLRIGSVAVAPQADNPLSRSVLRKDIYQRALNLGILRDPGSEIEDRQYQIDLQSINIGTAQWNQLKPEKESVTGGVLTESERNSQNPALEWNMASSIRRHQERRAILTPILTDFSVRITGAPAIIFTKIISPDNMHTEEILVCGHSLEVNITTNLDFFLNVTQVQLLHQLVVANMAGLEPSNKATEISKQEQNKMETFDGSMAEISSRYSGAQDSGIGSDSVKIRIVQIEQHSGTSQHRIARPSHQSSIVKNLNFIPFDIFITASRISLMTYSCTALPKSKSQELKDNEKTSKSSVNLPEVDSDVAKSSQACISTVTAEDLLGSSISFPSRKKIGVISLESLHASTRSCARQALGITIVRQPGRRGDGDLQLEPFLYLIVSQPSLLLSCHHRKQRVEISIFDAVLKGVASDYICTDPGKTLPEALDYCTVWLQTVPGEVDTKSGIPPSLVTLQIKDFLNGPADINLDISKPFKANLSFTKLDQINHFLKKIKTTNNKETSAQPDGALNKDELLASKSYRRKLFKPNIHGDGAHKIPCQENLWKTVSCFQKISVHTTQIVVSIETVPHPSKPCLLASLSALDGCLNVKATQKVPGVILGSSFLLNIKDFLLKTSLKERSRVLIGPCCVTASLEAKWCKHSGNPGPEQTTPKISIDLRGGLLQVFWGQEHLNCLVLLHELLHGYLDEEGNCEVPISEAVPQMPSPLEKNQPFKNEQSSDDLRTGLFQYIQDAEPIKMPGAYEVFFYNETEDTPGMMLWRYPEPRVLTLVRITPVPFNTTEDPDISTADLGDVLQVPCSLEYWDELQKVFVGFQEFSLSESKVCELQLPDILVSDQKKLVSSDLWRIVLNNNQNGADDQSSASESGSQSTCDQLVTPTALAACTRVDSCFTPWFVPSLCISFQFAYLEFHLCHHFDQLGTAPLQYLQPFISDKNVPTELEYMIISFREPHMYLQQWNNSSNSQKIRYAAEVECKLLEYRNVTMQSMVKPFSISGQIAVSSDIIEKLFDCTITVDSVFVNFGQHAVHSLNTAVQAWQQNKCPEVEELVFSHFVICNDTQETLRFGQVDTDENILLASLHSHQYSWRSHKSPQLLHICIEGWGNWRWSEPFSMDHAGTFIRTIQYKGRTASLIIKVQQLSGVQKQVSLCPMTKMTLNYLITTFSICSRVEQSSVKSSSLPCWDLMPDISQSTLDASLLQKQVLLAFSPATGASSPQCWSLPAVVRPEFPRQSVAVPVGSCREDGFCTRAIALTYQEHLGITYLTLSEDPSPRIIFHNRCTVTILTKENIKDIPKFEVYCTKIPPECSIHHELYHQISSYPDCKARDLLPSLLLRVELLDEVTTEWSDAVDINNQGTQVVFLTGFGYVYIDVVHQCGTVFVTLTPEGKAGPILTKSKSTLEKIVTFKMFITQLSLAVFDDLTHHNASSELLRLTLDNVFLHMAPAAGDLPEEETPAAVLQLYCVEVYCGDLQLDNQLYNKSNFHFAVLVCQGEKPAPTQSSRILSLPVDSKDLEEYKENCFIKLCLTLSEGSSTSFDVNEFSFELKPGRLYVEDTFVYYIKTLFDTYLPNSRLTGPPIRPSHSTQLLPTQVRQHTHALVNPVKLRKLVIQPVNLLVSIHASLKLYIASDHTPLSFSVFERGPIFTTARQLVHALAMHYAAGALFRAGWVVGSLEILGSPVSLVRSIGNGIADFFRLPYEGLTRGPGAFVSGVSRGTTSFVKHISKGTLTSITNLATSLARNMDRLSLDEEHYNRQEEWRRQLPESLGEGLRQGLSRLGISLLGAIAGIVDQPMQNFQRTSEAQGSAGHKAKGVISGVGKGLMGVFTKPIGGAAELVSQTGYGILHGAGLSQLPKQHHRPTDLQADQAPNSHVKYVWKMLQSLGRPEVHMALDVILVRDSGQEHEGCLLLTSEVLFVVSISEDTQQQAFPITEIDCAQDSRQSNLLIVQLRQPHVACDVEVDGVRERLSEQQYNRLVDYITKTSCHLSASCSSMQTPCPVVAVEPLPSTVKMYHYLVDTHFAQVFISKFTMVKNKALRKGFP